MKTLSYQFIDEAKFFFPREYVFVVDYYFRFERFFSNFLPNLGHPLSVTLHVA